MHKYISHLDPLYAYLVYLPMRLNAESYRVNPDHVGLPSSKNSETLKRKGTGRSAKKTDIIKDNSLSHSNIKKIYTTMGKNIIDLPIYYVRFDGVVERDLYFIVDLQLKFDSLSVQEISVSNDFGEVEDVTTDYTSNQECKSRFYGAGLP